MPVFTTNAARIYIGADEATGSALTHQSCIPDISVEMSGSVTVSGRALLGMTNTRDNRHTRRRKAALSRRRTP